MTQDGIRGNEEMPDATHNTTLPFTRYLTGAGDYTLCYFNNRVQYVRKKTGKPINFLLTEEMRNIIVKYQRQGQTWTRGLF